MSRAASVLWSVLRDRRGVSAIEFALVAPVFVLLMVGVIEAGLAIRTGFQVRQAAAAGAAYASKYKYDATGVTAAAQNATLSSGLMTTVVKTCGCPISTGFSNICTGTCTDGYAPRDYVVVTTSLSRRSMFKRSFGFASTITATAATMPGR